MSEEQRAWLIFLLLDVAASLTFGTWQNNVAAGLFILVLLMFILGCVMFNARMRT